jgi:hypothetical protein
MNPKFSYSRNTIRITPEGCTLPFVTVIKPRLDIDGGTRCPSEITWASIGEVGVEKAHAFGQAIILASILAAMLDGTPDLEAVAQFGLDDRGDQCQQTPTA